MVRGIIQLLHYGTQATRAHRPCLKAQAARIHHSLQHPCLLGWCGATHHPHSLHLMGHSALTKGHALRQLHPAHGLG